MKTFDPDALTPGIRQTVVWLRRNHFDTTDSGDGITNVLAGMEEALEFPHVVMVVKPELLISEAKRLKKLCEDTNIPLDDANIGIEASYSPLDGVALIMLVGVNDVLLDQCLD